MYDVQSTTGGVSAAALLLICSVEHAAESALPRARLQAVFALTNDWVAEPLTSNELVQSSLDITPLKVRTFLL